MAVGLHSSHYSLPPPHILLFELVVSSAVVGFTRPGSLARPAALPFVATCVYAIVSTASLHMRPRWASLLGGTSFSFLLQYIDLALLSQWSFEHHGLSLEASHASSRKDLGPSTSNPRTPHASQAEDTTTSRQWASQNDIFSKRLRFGWSSMWAYRHLNSKYEIKHVPPFSIEDPAYSPPRWLFVFRRTLIAAVCYLLIDLLGARPPPKNNAALFDNALVPVFRRLGSITSSQLKLRALSTAGFWLTLYCVLQGGHAAASAIAVTLGLSEVGDWRPIFGSVSGSYTLRDFWGYDLLQFGVKERFAPTMANEILSRNFWHQSLRKLITEPSSFIAHSILRLRKGSITARYLKIFLTFTLSGVMHNIAGISSGMPVQDYGVLQFFCTQPFGIMIEDAVRACHTRLIRGSGKSMDTPPPTLITHCIGYAWVAAFLLWSTPAWLYPQASRPVAAGPSSFLPYSIMQALRP